MYNSTTILNEPSKVPTSAFSDVKKRRDGYRLGSTRSAQEDFQRCIASSSTTTDVVKKAMESVPTKKVFQWFKDSIGQSVQSKRKEVKRIARKAEQIKDYEYA